MVEQTGRAVAVVGVGAILPDAPNAGAYWENLTSGRYSISEADSSRWDPALYFDPDPRAPDKTYSTLGGWVRDWDWSPLEWRLPIPPKVGDAMDRTQKWSVIAGREALLDYGYPARPLDPDRTAVVLGNAMAGDLHYLTSLRAYFPEYAEELSNAPSFIALPPDVRSAIVDEMHSGVRRRFPDITEDTMPGELANIIAGRVANLFDFHGPNFVVDAACASALAAIGAAIEGLEFGHYDAVLTGGIDANMGVNSFIKFCKIGALSATGTRPYHDGADGFVMGEGAAIFLLKRLADAEQAGDHVYAVIRGIGGSSDGRGKGITAPNPVGQEFAVARAWKNAGFAPTTATYIEGHGTSTRVGDVVEVESLSRVFADLGLKPGSIPLGSVKSNIGHLKSAAGAAGMLKAIKALDTRVIPPSLGNGDPNPNIDFGRSPLFINRELREWKAEPGQVRSAGVSAFGFGGTNFHVVLEEYIPGRLVVDDGTATHAMVTPEPTPRVTGDVLKTPLRGALVIGADDETGVLTALRTIAAEAAAGAAPPPAPPGEADLHAPVRLAIDYGDAAELAAKSQRAIAALETDNAMAWIPLANQGVYLGRGGPHLTAFLYTGQGSQYVNMLATLRHTEPIVAAMFEEADRVMEPILGRPLTHFIFADESDETAVAAAEAELRQTEITQPAVLAVDIAITRLMAAYGIAPDMVMGHSLGEYGALVASGAMSFEDALHAVAGRGREMAHVSVDDSGLMAAVFAPIDAIEAALDRVDGYVVIANINSTKQAVIGGATRAVEEAMELLAQGGAQVVPLSVSHAFHTEIVAPASEPLGRILTRLRLESPAIPVVANVDGEFYPMGPNVVPKMIGILERQIASPVQFVKGLRTLYNEGCRTFVEMGPKRALQGMAADVLGDDPEVRTLGTNHPKIGDIGSFNQALCGLYAAGLGFGVPDAPAAPVYSTSASAPPATATIPAPRAAAAPVVTRSTDATGDDMYTELGHLFADFLAKGSEIYSGRQAGPGRTRPDVPQPPAEPVVVSGAGLGLPGGDMVFGDDKLPAIMRGEQFIDTIPVKQRQLIAHKHITRLVKSEAGGGHFETIDNQSDVIKLAGRGGRVDLVTEFGFPEERASALDRATELAIGAGIEALRDAGIPLTMNYKTTTTGSRLPERWMLPEIYRDTTAVIFASAFPGADAFAAEMGDYWTAEARTQRLEELRALEARLESDGGTLGEEIRHRIHELEVDEARHPYVFDRKFLFRSVSMGHAQFAEYIGARGPNTQINAACASTTQAVALAEDWIGAGRCDRVVIISGDDVTSDHLLEWIGSGFLAVGAAATDEVVEEAALPFDRRRHGMILGMGAAALVVESATSVHERGLQPIAQVLSAVTANSAFHGSRLDPNHIKHVMEKLVVDAETKWGIDRYVIAPQTVFVSHETYTPARGGSAQAEIDALRHVFGEAADAIVISNTKGFTGHAMGVGVEDVVAVKSIETGVVPPVPNYKEVDPDLGNLNVSQGGTYPVRYALRLAAGFGSQISMTLYRVVPSPLGRHPELDELGHGYRTLDTARWERWLDTASEGSGNRVETVQRTLRIVDGAEPVVAPAAAMPVAVVTEPPAVGAPEPSPAPEPVAEAAPVVGDPVAAKVLEVVAEQTGYPPDMLDLDLDLEADLGIDTVKQAETFAAIRTAYDIERDDSLALRDYPTLNDVIQFVHDRRPDLTPTTTPPTAATAAPTTTKQVRLELVAGDDDASAAVPRRIPIPVLRPAMELCAATGVVLGPDTRVVVMMDRGGVGRALIKRLAKLEVTSLVIDDAPAADELIGRLDEFMNKGAVDGVYWLSALDVEPTPTEMDLATWREALRIRVKLLAVTMRHLYDADPFLVSGTRLGGLHGYDDAGALAPLGGAVTGFNKAYKREKADVLVKAVDFAASRKTAGPADALIEETLGDPGAVELGRLGADRYTIALREEALPVMPSGRELGPDSVFVITGAAGSIVSAITADLASHFGGTYHLLDLAPEPARDDPEVAAFASDKEALKRTLFDRLKATGERATPAMVEQQLAQIERRHAALAAMNAIDAAGGTYHYHQLDLRDGDAVEAAVRNATSVSGRVDLLVHAGGLEISRRLSDKPQDEFDLVFDVKADGWFNLLHALGDSPLGASVVFSSVAGRFGNDGQTDYSAANDLLCKSTSSFRNARAETLGIALDWTAWGDIGMATRGSIPTVMKAAGIDMLPARAGIPVVRREVTGRTATGEQVVGLELGILLAESDPAGGLDLSEEGPVAQLAEPPAAMVHHIESLGPGRGLVVTGELDPTVQPFLYDHQIDGTAVLPGVMGIEAFAEAATLLVPERHVIAVEDVDFLAPFKFYRNEPRTFRVEAQFMRDGSETIAECRLVGERTLATSADPQITVHFTGRVRLGDKAPELDPTDVTVAGDGAIGSDEIYSIYFHGPAYQVLRRAGRASGGVSAEMAADLPAATSPASVRTVTAPRLAELAFQASGIWEMGTTGVMGLPMHIDRVVFAANVSENEQATAMVTPADGSYTVRVANGSGATLLTMEGYRTAALPVALSDETLEPIRRALAESD